MTPMGSYACNAAEVKVEFQPIKTGFLVIFHRPDITQDNTKEKSSEKIRRMISMNPTVSALDLSKQLGISSRAVEKQIEILKKEGFIKRIGPDKGGHWEIVKK